jgi:ribosome-associated protein
MAPLVTRNPEQDEKSRSQIRREFLGLKKLGIQLAGLSRRQLTAVPLSEGTREALLASKEMTRTALQRQYRYISSLLVEEDVETIRAALANQLRPHADEVAALHQAERWRDRLLSADEGVLTEFVEQYPECDRTHLRQLVRNAKKERDLDKPPKSGRQLLRYVRELSAGQD